MLPERRRRHSAGLDGMAPDDAAFGAKQINTVAHCFEVASRGSTNPNEALANLHKARSLLDGQPFSVRDVIARGLAAARQDVANSPMVGRQRREIAELKAKLHFYEDQRPHTWDEFAKLAKFKGRRTIEDMAAVVEVAVEDLRAMRDARYISPMAWEAMRAARKVGRPELVPKNAPTTASARSIGRWIATTQNSASGHWRKGRNWRRRAWKAERPATSSTRECFASRRRSTSTRPSRCAKGSSASSQIASIGLIDAKSQDGGRGGSGAEALANL